MPLAILFPGQGAQAPALGEPWRDHAAWVVVERASDVLGEDVAPLVLGDPGERTRESQLSVFFTSLMAWEAVRPLLADEPVAFAGHSLGQVTALVAAGVLSFEDGVRFAVRRATVTQDVADRHPGRMAALLGPTDEQVAAALAVEGCWEANENAPGQLVVAGTPEGVEAGLAAAKEAGLRKAMPLKVGGAFHTPLFDDARPAMAEHLASIALRDPAVPVVSNHDGRAYRDGEGWRQRLVDHVVSPVRWRQSLETLAALGVDVFAEVGPGQILTGTVKRTAPDATAVTVNDPAGAENVFEGVA